MNNISNIIILYLMAWSVYMFCHSLHLILSNEKKKVGLVLVIRLNNVNVIIAAKKWKTSSVGRAGGNTRTTVYNLLKAWVN